MARLQGQAAENPAWSRSGYWLHPDGSVLEYDFDLEEAPEPERWAQGVTLFHNPGALSPLPFGTLPCTSEWRRENGRFHRVVRGLHTMTSLMTSDGRPSHAAPRAPLEAPLRPNSPEWLVALERLDPRRAILHRVCVEQAESVEVCSICGDRPSQLYRHLMAPVAISHILLCSECHDFQTNLGMPLTSVPAAE
jgi:hypothetical protein